MNLLKTNHHEPKRRRTTEACIGEGERWWGVKITINNVERNISNGINTGAMLLESLAWVAGEQFRGYWLQKLNNPDGIETAVMDADIINEGDCFWAIPPCHI